MGSFLPTIAMLGATLLWASSATASKLALIDVSVPEMVAFRILGAALIMWTMVLVVRRKIPWRGPMPLLMGVLEPGLVTFIIALGVSLTSAVNASVVWGLLPLTQPFVARLVLGEPVQRSVVAGAALAIAGVALLFYAKHQDGSGSLLGDFFLVCGVGCAAANQLLARRVATSYREPIVTTSYQLLTASVLALIYLALTTTPSHAYQGADNATWAILGFLILATAGPFFLYNFSLQYISVGRISLFGPLTGPIGAVIATIAFGEPVDNLILAAIVLALSGAMAPALAQRWSGRR